MKFVNGNDIDSEVCDWWRTEIIEMQPGIIRYRGFAIEELVGNISFTKMIWLMVVGELPNDAQAKLLEAALVSSVDHGPQAPSIAIARMAATCGVDINNVIGSAINVLGDVHGGAGEQALEIYQGIASQIEDGIPISCAVGSVVDDVISRGHFIPGFGHRFHPIDPRALRLLELVGQAVKEGVVSGVYWQICIEMEKQLETHKGKRIPINIDGATAVIYAELGFSPRLARGLFCLSRAVGILAHALEQEKMGGRNKGPVPKKYLWTYEGPARRSLNLTKEDK